MNGAGKHLRFTYDVSGRPMTVYYNDTTYYYSLNAQGDVMAILRRSGEPIVEYTYDAWGNVLSVTGSWANSLGKYNPLRYRGYVYDHETGLYYLQSRYYDPEVGRFLNADIDVATGQGQIGNNMFAYCGNNPVNRTDTTGNAWWHWAAAAAVVVAAAVAVVVTAGGAAAAMVAITSVANGVAACTTACTVAAGAFIGSATGFATAAVGALMTAESIDDVAAYGETALYSTASSGFWGGVAAYFMPQSQTPAQCFVAGTTVLAAAGAIPIEEICEGDMVWAWDEETGDITLKQVVETYVNETNELIHIFVNGEEIVTTPNHPFYSPVKGWTDAVRLRAGDILVLVNGEYVVVEKVQHELLEAPVTVYNFQVADYHTYYVAGTGIPD